MLEYIGVQDHWLNEETNSFRNKNSKKLIRNEAERVKSMGKADSQKWLFRVKLV